MTAPTETLTLKQMLVEASSYWKAARESGDILAEDQWLRAIDHLLDRPDCPRP